MDRCSPLQQSQKIVDEQQKLVDKAKLLKNKLESAKHQRQSQAQKKLREMTVAHYQTYFEEFIQQFGQYAQSQTASLQLIKQFKLNEIAEFEKAIEQSLDKLDRNLTELNQHERQLMCSKQTALQFLKTSETTELAKLQEEIDLSKEMRIEQYVKSIGIS